MMLSVYGEADPRASEILRAHTGVCPGCEAELASLEKLTAGVNTGSRDDISGELLAEIKARSALVLPAGKKQSSPGRLILRPVLAAAIIGIIIFSFFKFMTVDDSVHIAMEEDYEYRLLDESLVKAENSLYSINIELLTGLYDY